MKMKTRSPQISQITQTVTLRGTAVGYKEYQTDESQSCFGRLCNLRNLWKSCFQENLWT